MKVFLFYLFVFDFCSFWLFDLFWFLYLQCIEVGDSVLLILVHIMKNDKGDKEQEGIKI